jgi:NADH oxidase (H2O2-forming)
MKIVIIGGGSAGTTCAFALRKQNKDAVITILEKSSYTEYSPCALPYVLSGEIKHFDDIILFEKEAYRTNDISLSLNTEVIAIDKGQKRITYRKEGETQEIAYDKLVLATGSTPFVPPIPGVEDVNYTTLKTIDDAKEIAQKIRQGATSIVIGGGLIGAELSVSLAQKKENVILIEAEETIFPSLLDTDMAERMKNVLENENITVYTNQSIQKITSQSIVLQDFTLPFDTLFFCTGVRANTYLASNTGLAIDKAICVNEYLQTSEPDIYACGDCVESIECNTSEKICSQLGTTAVRQAQTIAHNILSERKKPFAPVLNNTITKIGDTFVASVGLTTKRAQERGIATVTSRYTGNVRSDYYPSQSTMTVKLIASKEGTIIGAQIIGDEEVAGRINTVALAIQKQCHVCELAALETCYNPASAPLFDSLTIVADICLKKLYALEKSQP